jgi:hypothetical protein
MATTNLKRGSTWWVVTLLILASLVLFFWQSVDRSAGPFPVTFLGMTNDPVQGRMASFMVANASRLPIVCYIGSPQLKSNGVWLAWQQPPGTSKLTLPPGQASTFSVAAPMNAVEWRAPVQWGYIPTGFRGIFRGIIGTLKHNFNLNWYALRHGERLTYNNGAEVNLYMSYSAAIAE